jgi:hypothetical protein
MYAEALQVSREWLETGRGDPRVVAIVEKTPEPPSAGFRLGTDALESVLVDYKWPSGLAIHTIDEIVARARSEAQTPAGAQRAMSMWRAYLDSEAALLRPRHSRVKELARASRKT